ncbi:MAG TPA: PA domain-containing protein [Actinomycetota bacterium]|nr:PA domain-containing protein [Actinomycetota bacterium]
MALIVIVLVSTTRVGPAGAQECAASVDEKAFPSASRIRALNKVMADAGARPTASPAHHRYVAWLESQLRRIKGVRVRKRYESINRWLERGTRLSVQGRRVRVSGAVPYSKAGSVRGQLIYVPAGTAVSASDVKGKIVLRDALPGTGPQAIFFAVAYYVHDPDGSIDYAGNYERDFSGYAQRVTDLQEAAKAGAAGVVFAHTLPYEQVRGNYQPYNGVFWDVPAAFVGVDEGEQLKRLAGKNAELVVRAQVTPNVPSPTLIGTLTGGSRERIVIASHTDGMNAVWDNGPTSILALAQYFAKLPLECRPRTLEFVMSTAHLYLSENGAHNYAHEELDPGYDEGTVAFAVALEHLGAKEFWRFPRKGRPGFELRYTGRSEPFVTFSHESPVSLQALLTSVIERDIRRTWILRGADAPQVGFPPHRSYGGEGGAYHGELLPTLAGITGPNTLYNPAFGLDELVDFELMRRQTMVFGDTILKLQDLPRQLIAGADTVYRAGRDLSP